MSKPPVDNIVIKDVTIAGLRITSEQAKKLDDLRRQESDLPARVEMLRRLIDRAELTETVK